jgi:RNA polymerase sigma factor (sigma-70 family)
MSSMSDASSLSAAANRRVEDCLSRLAANDPSARDELMAIASDRMRGIAHRMLRTFPAVRRWEQTDDVSQNAALRLYRALSQIKPRDPRGFIGLCAVQVRRELLDLTRKHAGLESYAANHETNVHRVDGRDIHKIDVHADGGEPLDHLARWTRLHEAAASLPIEEREVFDLAWYMGLTQKEIGSLLGCSVRTVKRRWESAKILIVKAVEGDVPA